MTEARSLLPTEEEAAAATLVREFAADRAPLAALRELRIGEVPPPPRELFREMAELDIFSQALPEELGGLGMSPLASGLMVEAAGGELMPGPLVDQLVAATVLGAEADIAPPLIAAEHLFALALCEPRVGPGTVSGEIRGLVLGPRADRWLLLGKEAWAVIDPADVPPAAITADRVIDPVRPTYSVALTDEIPARTATIGTEAGDGHLAYAYGIVAMWSLGASQRLLDETVAYVKERQQFGRPVGSFQAMKHRAANAYVEILHARCLAAAALGSGKIGQARLARLAADRTYRSVAASCLHMHGGIGFTAEASVHLFLKNAELLRRWPRPAGSESDVVRSALGLDE